MMLTFFIVLACATVLYYLIPLKHRWIVLLAASIIFYSVISTYLTPFVIITSLSVWLKEYVFYSVALSPKLMKFCGKLKKKHKNHFTKILPTLIALLFVWLCNGLWHGAQWNYIVYGMYYFVIISLGMICEPLFKKLYVAWKINPDGKVLNVLRHIRTLLIIFIGETIFGATSLPNAWITLTSVFPSRTSIPPSQWAQQCKLSPKSVFLSLCR